MELWYELAELMVLVALVAAGPSVVLWCAVRSARRDGMSDAQIQRNLDEAMEHYQKYYPPYG
ncbi:hypothetical protein HYV74_01755 [Candidatus Uhrbacteria bacterium]|nr:hypothetical protein [Candidatus Uhrbacteria bacterium]